MVLVVGRARGVGVVLRKEEGFALDCYGCGTWWNEFLSEPCLLNPILFGLFQKSDTLFLSCPPKKFPLSDPLGENTLIPLYKLCRSKAKLFLGCVP